MNYNERRAAASWDRFRQRVEELGGTVLEESWKGSQARHRVRCAEGHENCVIANNVNRGQGLCRVCAKNEPDGAWDRFRKRVEELGGTVLEESWKGSQARHRVRCAEGHEPSVNPAYVGQGGGICARCVNLEPDGAWDRFRKRVEELGGTVLEESWKGSQARHRVRCAEGHEGITTPNTLTSGRGMCRSCAGKVWDAFYVVHNPDVGVLKFGITSGDPHPRLANHAREGFRDVLMIRTGLPGSDAPDLEQELIRLLRLVGVRPVRGREYFSDAVRNVVVSLAEAWLTTPMVLTPPLRSCTVVATHRNNDQKEAEPP